MTDSRPLSPHLSIHKKSLNSLSSIFHRITGIGLSLGSILICLWIAFVAMGDRYYLLIKGISSSFFFNLILFVWTIGIFYHLFNGIRYIFWSFGYGLELKTVNNTSYLVIILTIVSTIFLWIGV